MLQIPLNDRTKKEAEEKAHSINAASVPKQPGSAQNVKNLCNQHDKRDFQALRSLILCFTSAANGVNACVGYVNSMHIIRMG